MLRCSYPMRHGPCGATPWERDAGFHLEHHGVANVPANREAYLAPVEAVADVVSADRLKGKG